MDVTENSAVDVVEAADRALHRIERTAKHAEECWPIVIAGLHELRRRAYRSAGTDDIESGRYRAEFSRLRGMHRHLAKLSPSEASACCWAAEHPELYEAAKSGMNTHHGQAPTPYGVYQRAMRIARAKDATAAKNAKETREALEAKAAEADQDVANIAEDRDRIMVLGHEQKLLLERRIEELETKLAGAADKPVVVDDELKAERAQARAAEAGLKAEMELLRRENRELQEELGRARQRIAELEAGRPRKSEREATERARQLGVTPASVLAELHEVVRACGGNLTAATKALGYRSQGSLRALLAKGEKMTAAAAVKCQERIDAWRVASS